MNNDRNRRRIPPNQLFIIAWGQVRTLGAPRTGEPEVRTAPAAPVRPPSGRVPRARSAAGRAPGTGRRGRSRPRAGQLRRRGVGDDDGLTGTHHHPVHDAGVEQPREPAPAEHLHLDPLDVVGDLQQPLGAGEQPRAEVGGQPERVDVDVPLVDEVGELIDLPGGEELRLVDDQVVHPLAVGPPIADERPQVGAAVDLRGVPEEPDPGADLGRRGTVALGDQEPVPALTALVVVDLQRERRLPAVHRAVEEPQVRRRRVPAPVAGGGNGVRPRGRRRGARAGRAGLRHSRSGGWLPASTTARRIGSAPGRRSRPRRRPPG